MRSSSRCGRAAAPVAALLLLGSSCGQDPVEPGTHGVRQRWYQAQPSGFPNARPAVSDDLAYFATGGGFVVARDLSTGTARWTTLVGASRHAASPEIDGANLVLRNGVLVVPVSFHTSGLDAASGAELWRYEAPLDTIDKALPRPGYLASARIAADENTVYIPAWGATVSAVDVRTGATKWIWRVEPTLEFRSGASGVSVSGDTVFATIWHNLNRLGGLSEAWLLALDRTTGRELWRVVLPVQGCCVVVAGAPAVWRNLVVMTMVNGYLFAVDRDTRQIAWQVPPKAPQYGLATALISGAAVYGDVVYANGVDRKIGAFRASDGQQLWESVEVGQLYDDMLVTERHIYASDGAKLIILDRQSGVRYSSLGHPRGDDDFVFSASVAVHKGQVFVPISNGAWSFDEP
ncbi:MAG: PQQ-binding-like beta-propeller repeat protein [Gemmatimonadaceae bacterium]